MSHSPLPTPHSPQLLDLRLKTLTLEDLSDILSLDKACFGGLWTVDAYQRELDSENTDLLGLYSPYVPERLLAMGCFWTILDEAHITLVATHPHYQRQGLGQAILYSLLQTACLRGLERATLEVRPSNTNAISLYEKFGFKTAGRRRHYYQDNGEDALILWLGHLQYPQFQKNLQQWHANVRDRVSQSGWHLKLEG